MPDLADAEAWVERAAKNARGAEMFQQDGEWPLGACMHAQQAIEMSLKAVLVAKGVKHQFTHDLDLLHKNIPSSSTPSFNVGQDGLRTQLARLTEWWLHRYPTQNAPRAPTREDAESALDLANQFVEWARVECGMEPNEHPAPDN